MRIVQRYRNLAGKMASAKYHQLQAKTLLELAEQTADLRTAAALRKLAADHTELAVVANDQKRITTSTNDLC
jgi:hypothetical protein